MDLRIDVDSTDADDLGSLAEWLRDEPGLGHLVEQRPAPIADGTMGGAVDLIVALGSLGLVPAFVTVLTTWLKTRKSNVRIVVHEANGRQVEVSADQVGDLQKLIVEISDLLKPDDDEPAATA